MMTRLRALRTAWRTRRPLRWHMASPFYHGATALYAVGSWLMQPYGEHHLPDGDTFVAETMARQAAENHGAGMATRQLAAAIMADDMSTGERVAGRTNGHGPKVGHD